MSSPRKLLRSLTGSQFRHVDKAVAVLWHLQRSGSEEARTANELASEIKAAGYPGPNVTRLRTTLDRDKRVVKSGNGYRLHVAAVPDLDRTLIEFGGPVMPPPSDSVMPLELFFSTRSYLEKVVHQTNAAYDHALFDCCAVMLRRLMETLLIEVYEHEGREAEIKGNDGHYYFLSKLVVHAKSDTHLTLSRNAKSALDTCKRLGDLSAHNRRYNAVRADIDRSRDDFRLAAEELLVLAGLR